MQSISAFLNNVLISICIHYTIKIKKIKLGIRQAPRFIKGAWD